MLGRLHHASLRRENLLWRALGLRTAGAATRRAPLALERDAFRENCLVGGSVGLRGCASMGSPAGGATSAHATSETKPVVIIGGGPVGLLMSIQLSRFGVRSVLLEADDGRRSASRTHPRAHVVHSRAMELLREIGVEEKAWAMVPPSEDWRNFRYCKSMLGDDFAKQDHFRTEEFKMLCVASPSRVAQLSQPRLEQLLYDRAIELAAESGAELVDGARVTDVSATGNGDGVRVTAALKDGDSLELDAAYVVAADGAQSQIRKSVARVPMVGAHDLESFASIHFTTKELGRRLAASQGGAMLSFVFNDQAMGVVVSHDMRAGEWVAHVPFFPPAQSIDTLFDAAGGDARATILAMLGGSAEELFDLEVLSVRAWGMHATCARQFSALDDRVFLVGDAAHQFPPSGGFGVNAGMADAHNLAWKLAHVQRGWASHDLLASYDRERRPVVEDALSVAIDNYRRGLVPARALGLDRVVMSTVGSLANAMPQAAGSGLVRGMLHVGKQHLRAPTSSLAPGIRKVVEEDHLALPLLFPRTDKGYVYPPMEQAALPPSTFWLQPTFPRNDQTRWDAARITRGGILPHVWLRDTASGRIISSLDLVSRHGPRYVRLELASPDLASESLHGREPVAPTSTGKAPEEQTQGSAETQEELPKETPGVAHAAVESCGPDVAVLGESVTIRLGPGEQVDFVAVSQGIAWRNQCSSVLVRPDGHVLAMALA